jgi:hypothetical protein
VGRTLLQLCRLLKLRAIALLRPPAKAGGAGGERQWEGVSKQLSELGATLVLRDEGTIKVGEAWLVLPLDGESTRNREAGEMHVACVPYFHNLPLAVVSSMRFGSGADGVVEIRLLAPVVHGCCEYQ